jgi:hypothetical protein
VTDEYSGPKLVAQNSDRETAAQEALDAATDATQTLLSNLIRVARGAGKPSEIVRDAAAVVEAFDAFFEVKRYYPGERVASELRKTLWDSSMRSDDWGYGVDTMLRGALQLGASRLVGSTDSRTGGAS